MKKAILSFGFILAAFVMFAQSEAPVQVDAQDGPKITVNKTTHDYGTIEQGSNGDCEFIVTNSGNAPLILNKCKGSCGCTVPKCTGDPIAPGESTTIKVTYDTKRIGGINKSVTIESNAVNEKVKIVKIKGTITKAANGSPELSPAGPMAK
jgi:hypothetical protein